MAQNRQKIGNIEELQRKLDHLRKLIDKCAKKDPDFKSVFIKQLFPILRAQANKLNEIEENT